MNAINWKRTRPFCFAAFFIDFSSAVFLVAVPYLAMEFGAMSLALGVLAAIRGLTYILGCLSATFLSDRLNRRTLIIVSALVIAAVLAATPAAADLWHLYFITILWAISLSLYWPSVFAWLGDSHPSDELATATCAVNLSWSVAVLMGGLIGGWLFQVAHALPFLVAAVSPLLVVAVMARAPREYAKPNGHVGESAIPGAKRTLLAVWIGNIAICCLLGLMGGVFPKLGSEIGVTSAIFGLFICLMGVGRSLVFLLGFRWSNWVRDWRLAALAQVVAAGMVATVSRTNSHVWLGLVFVTLGLSMGVTYHRGIYTSIKGAASRGMKSGRHEAALLMGVLLGSLGGGALAHFWGLRMPYLPMACLAVLLVIVQIVLIASARRAAADVRPAEFS